MRPDLIRNIMDVSTTATADATFYVANRPCVIDAVRLTFATAETTAATLTLQVTKDSGTDAPGAGDDLLATALDCKAAANTVQTGVLVAAASTLELSPGDRLAVDYSAAANELAGVCLTVSLREP